MFPAQEYIQESRFPQKDFDKALLLARKAVTPMKAELRKHIEDTRPPRVKQLIVARKAEGAVGNGSAQAPQTLPAADVPPALVTNLPTAASPSPSPSRPRSPSKSTLRALPSKSPQKRSLPADNNVVPDPEQPVASSSSSAASPAKRRRTDSTSGGTIGEAPPTPPDSTASSTPVQYRSDAFPLGPSRAPTPAEPFTPSFPSLSCTTRPAAPSVYTDPFLPLPQHRTRRYRPAYIDAKQWCSCDPKLVLLRQVGEDHREEMTKLYGNPLAGEAQDDAAAMVT